MHLDQTPQNAAFDQGLHCLHTDISIKIEINMNSSVTPKIGNRLVLMIRMA